MAPHAASEATAASASAPRATVASNMRGLARSPLRGGNVVRQVGEVQFDPAREQFLRPHRAAARRRRGAAFTSHIALAVVRASQGAEEFAVLVDWRSSARIRYQGLVADFDQLPEVGPCPRISNDQPGIRRAGATNSRTGSSPGSSATARVSSRPSPGAAGPGRRSARSQCAVQHPVRYRLVGWVTMAPAAEAW